MNDYTAGQIVECEGPFTDEDTGQPVDPTTVTFKYAVYDTSGVQQHTASLLYTNASSPEVGVVARTGVGVYVAQVDTTGLDGYWTVEFLSTGTGQTVGTDMFRVLPDPI